MGTGIKIIFTIAVALVGMAILVIDTKANNAGADWIWKLGKRDPIRNAICRPDGTLKKYTKLVILIWCAIFLVIIWLVPNKS
jgi:hypothetical protein